MPSDPHAVIFAVESSCDETAAAVVKDGREVLSSVVFTQIPLHKVYGGVVPEIASRSHVEKIGAVCAEALAQANMTIYDVDAVAVTNGPGLVGALLVGVSYAKGLAYAAQKPLIAVHHIEGHIAANLIAHKDLDPPFVCLVASGGHTHIVHVDADWEMKLLGRTRDDAAGEAFDKVARILGLPYPGGPELEKLAKEGDPNAYRFHSAFNAGEHLDMSFSGLKTAAMNLVHHAEQKGESLCRADVAASFQKAVDDLLCAKAVHATLMCNCGTLALAGGVAANGFLRSRLEQAARKAGLRFVCPPMNLCTDNAAMIGAAAWWEWKKGNFAPLSLNALPSKKFAQQNFFTGDAS